MDVSLSQTAQLNCPQCQQPFTADVWRIVDTAARPELLAQLRAGTLHDLPCPHCGHSGTVDAPLLLYRPDNDPVLLFSPARNTSTEQDREQALELVHALQERLGDQWRDAWVAEGLPGVPRELLPAVLSDKPEAALEELNAQMQQAMAENPLLQAIQALLEASSPAEVLAAIQTHPELLSDEADAMLRQGLENARRMGNEEMTSHIEQRYETLHQLREQDIDPEALAELAQAEEQITGALAALPEDIRQLLSEVSSPEELEAALAARPELRDALAAVAQQAAAPQPRENISYAASWPYTCPTCGHRWEPDVWQIVDAPERPDLVARLHAGTLHAVTCPECGETSAVIAPLLYHDRSAEQLLLAAPEGWDSERGQRENHRLFPVLRAGLHLEGAFPPYLEHTTHLHGGLPQLSRYLRGEVDESVTLPPELRRIMEALGPELGRQFLEIMRNASNPGEFEAELGKHPELQAALESVGQHTGDGGRLDIPPAFAADVQELQKILARLQREPHLAPRRVAILERMLVRPEIEATLEFKAAVLNDLGNAYSDLPTGDRGAHLQRAIACYQQALTVYTAEAAPDDHRRTQRNLARLYLGEELWGQAITALQGALAATDLLYQTSATPEARRAELREIRDLPSRLAYALAQTGASTDTVPLQTAVLTLEQNRARWLSEALARYSQKPPDVPEHIWQVFVTHREHIGALQEEFRQPEGTPGKRDYLTLSQALAAAYATLEETVNEIREYDAAFMPAPTFEHIQNTAQAACPLVYFAISPAGTVALIVTATAIHPVHTPLTEDQLREHMQGPSDDPELGGYLGAYGAWRNAPRDPAAVAAWFTTLEETTRRIGETLMEPVVRALADLHLDHAVLIPTGWLGLLPLHVAGNGDTHRPITFTYAPNARALTAAQEIAACIPPEKYDLFAVDDPLNNLKYSKQAVAAVSAHFKHPWVARNSHATRLTALKGLREATVYHFFCHGSHNWQEVLESGLALYGEPLTLRDVLGVKSSGARLAFLSACETGILDTNITDEVINLPAGFLQAGVAGIVGTLWSVAEPSTALLVEKFYNLWLEDGYDPPEALRQAQLWLRDEAPGDWSHLFYWAGFTYTGV